MTEFPSHPDDEDDTLNFAALMQDVKRITHDRADTGRAGRNQDASLEIRRAQAIRKEERYIDGLSSEAATLVESDEELLFAVPGVQLGRLKRLRQGHIPWEQGLDLHGFTVDQAREELVRFIRDAQRQQLQCVIVVHGKAFSQEGQTALIKSHTNDWLRQMPQVLAFCSAQAKDGGTGAVYVLLRRTRDQRN